MSTSRALSRQTQTAWLVDVVLFLGAVIAVLSGLYFLFLPVGGYQGGRNPMYGVTILFSRHTWEDLHMWGGAAMIAAAAVHIVLHWSWIVGMARRMMRTLVGRPPSLSGRGWINVAVNVVVAVSFLVTAASGLYFLFFPAASGHAATATVAIILFNASTWDLMHTWGGVALIVAALAHLAIHWGWITKVTRGMVQHLARSRVSHPRPALAPVVPEPMRALGHHMHDVKGETQMKRLIAGIVLCSIVAVLVVGAVNRTNARASDTDQGNGRYSQLENGAQKGGGWRGGQGSGTGPADNHGRGR